MPRGPKGEKRAAVDNVGERDPEKDLYGAGYQRQIAVAEGYARPDAGGDRITEIDFLLDFFSLTTAPSPFSMNSTPPGQSQAAKRLCKELAEILHKEPAEARWASAKRREKPVASGD